MVICDTCVLPCVRSRYATDAIVELMVITSRVWIIRKVGDAKDLFGFFSDPLCSEEQLVVFNLAG